MKKIAFVASEGVPFIKTGGLADVVGSLPLSIDSNYFDVRVFLPKYVCIKQNMQDKMNYITHFYLEHENSQKYVGIFEAEEKGIHYYFIDNEEYFNGIKPYSSDDLWEIKKWVFFSKAVLSILPIVDFKPHVIHCHDWQTGMIPVYLKERFKQGDFFSDIKSIITIHNLKFQGKWDIATVKEITGLADYYFTPDKLEAYKDANLLKGGLVFADAITTVSEEYANEIKTSFYGEGLDGLLRARDKDLRGILNGIDYHDFDPATDPSIEQNYDKITFRKEKFKNKKALQKELGLQVNEKIFMIGIVSRLTDQKGLDLVNYMMDEICAEEIQMVILGTGDTKYENQLRHFEWKYPEKVSANIYYSEALSHKVYASCDAFLMPSLFEPCGLSQLISLRYGTVPIVRETGGLADTVEAYNEYENTGTGFCFKNFNAHEMLYIIKYAQHIFYDKKREWNKIVDRGMDADFSWDVSAKKYQEMYDWLIGF